MYFTFSILIYYRKTWHGQAHINCATSLAQLYELQKRSVRIICYTYGCAPSRPPMAQLRMLNVSSCRSMKLQYLCSSSYITCLPGSSDNTLVALPTAATVDCPRVVLKRGLQVSEGDFLLPSECYTFWIDCYVYLYLHA